LFPFLLTGCSFNGAGEELNCDSFKSETLLDVTKALMILATLIIAPSSIYIQWHAIKRSLEEQDKILKISCIIHLIAGVLRI